MDQQINSMVNAVHKLTPSMETSEIEYLITQMSQRSGIGPMTILNILYDDLRTGIPFRYTAVGKIRSIFL